MRRSPPTSTHSVTERRVYHGLTSRCSDGRNRVAGEREGHIERRGSCVVDDIGTEILEPLLYGGDRGKVASGRHVPHPSSAAASRFRKRPTSVTTPVDSTEPRSASFVTTAGLMSTQMSRTPAGVMFPTPIEWSIE